MVTAHLRHTRVSRPEPTIDQIERQIRWENEGAERGVRRLREALAAPGMTTLDTAGGKRALQEVMAGMVPAVQEAQRLAIESITNSAGRQSDWWWVLPLLDAAQLAYITVNAVLTSVTVDGKRDQRKFTGAALHVARNVQTQIEFEGWKAGERQKANAANKENRKAVKAGADPEEMTPVKNMFEALCRNAKKVDTRAFRKWQQKLQIVADEKWSLETGVQVGAFLLELMVRNSDGWFEIVNQAIVGGKTERRLVLSQAAIEAMSDLNTRAEVARPYLMPMIVRPARWRRVETSN
jgi:DNA-directed RNA polymerase